ncbi:MAG: hypothetical protein ACYCTE_08140 [Acidimicrobiales bacterium]
MLGGDVAGVTAAIFDAGAVAWFSAAWAFARAVVEFIPPGSGAGGQVPLGLWVGRHLGAGCGTELSKDVAAMITAAVDGRPSDVRRRWSALGPMRQFKCGQALLELATIASRAMLGSLAGGVRKRDDSQPSGGGCRGDH